MSLQSPINPPPALTIVVPFSGGNESAFEASLASVLEHQPERAEVVVAHDGSYSNPFDLRDEVRFAVGSRKDLPALIRTGVDKARAPITYVLAEGCLATPGWADSFVEHSTSQALNVGTPVILQAKSLQNVASLGWQERRSGFCSPTLVGASLGSVDEANSVNGSVLQASVWKTDLLRILTLLPTGADSLLTQYAWSLTADLAGYPCVVFPSSHVIEGVPKISCRRPSIATARRMQAVRMASHGGHFGTSLADSLGSALSVLHKPSMWNEVAGRWTAPLIRKYRQRFSRAQHHALQLIGNLEQMKHSSRPQTLPTRYTHSVGNLRKAS